MAWAGGMAPEDLADAEPPGDSVTTPREIDERPGVATVHMPGRGLAPRAAGGRLWGRDLQSALPARVVEMPGVQWERAGVRQEMGQRWSNLQRG